MGNEPMTKEQLKAVLDAIVESRANPALLERLSQPDILDWLKTMIGTAFDRVERKPKQQSSIRA